MKRKMINIPRIFLEANLMGQFCEKKYKGKAIIPWLKGTVA
jgi:hypothetical protein